MLVDVLEFVLAEAYDVTIAQSVFLDEFAVDVCPVRTAEIFEKRIVEYRNDQCVLTTDGKIVDLDVIVGFPADGNPFVLQREFPLHCPIHAQNHLRHRSVLFSCLSSERY